MHELSIAQSVVSTVRDALGERRVLAVTLRVGPLAGVVPEALAFGWDVVTHGTPLAGSRLVVERVSVAARCSRCDTESEHVTPPPLRCPACDATCLPLGDGRTLEVGSVEVEDDVDTGAGAGVGAVAS